VRNHKFMISISSIKSVTLFDTFAQPYFDLHFSFLWLWFDLQLLSLVLQLTNRSSTTVCSSGTGSELLNDNFNIRII